MTRLWTSRVGLHWPPLPFGGLGIHRRPGWRRHRHEASEDAVLFSVTERPVQQKLGLWREERF